MRRLLLLSLVISAFFSDATAAARAGRGSGSTQKHAVSVRAARTPPAGGGVSAAAPTGGQAVNRGRAATTPASGGAKPPSGGAKPAVAARAATKQKVINTGTKIATATKNITVSDKCREKYEGCMDSFCMLENDSGGRCACSDRNAELDAILAEIEKLDQQSYQMATFGVEKIEMGMFADDAIAAASAAADEALGKNKDKDSKKKARKALDLSAWDTTVEVDDEDIFGGSSSSTFDGKEGDALHLSAAELCVEQIPECEKDISMLQLMYSQRIKSDCSAYENSLKQQKNASTQKLQTAERALREAALEQLQTANKYDLGQCAVEFKKCMQTTGGCGDDFSSCAVMNAMNNTSTRKSTSKKAKNYQIKGAITDIEISASTYDMLISKKPLCESITKSCVAVADQVWDTFLREVAPQIKNAELIAEDKARQDCIGNISSCFQKACKDNIDPDDKDGSYDMCLSRPETMLNVCKIPLNNCGIDASSEAKAKQSNIWDFVVARLAAIRVNACTAEVKECLQSEDRCGEDYTQCIGLDMESIEQLCPPERMVGCQKKQGNEDGSYSYAATWDEIRNIVQGIWLSIDNSMLDNCQKLVNEKMIEICGDVSNCIAFDSDNNIGTESLISYKNNNGDYVIEGLVSFGNVQVTKPTSTNDDVKFGQYEISIGEYKEHLDTQDPTTERVIHALESVSNKINQKIALLSQDPKIKMCVEGRDTKQINRRTEKTAARFPSLLDSSILAIISAGIDRANKNYTKKYNELLGKAVEEQNDNIKSILCSAMAAGSTPQCTEWATEAGDAICIKYENPNFDNVFTDAENAGITSNDTYSTKYVISGAKVSDLVNSQSNAKSEYTQTDQFGNMVGKISTSSIYQAENNTCLLTTTTTMCAKMKEIITTHKSQTCGGGGISFLGGGTECGGGGIWRIGGSKKKTTTSTRFEGVACTEFMEPETTTTTVQM